MDALKQKIARSADYTRNADRCTGDEQPCVVCGKPILRSDRTKSLRLNTMAEAIPHEAECPPEEDMGGYPIGADCLRRHPELRPFAR